MHQRDGLLGDLEVDMREMPSHGRMNYCCGGGAGVFLINRAAPLRKVTFDQERIKAKGRNILAAEEARISSA